MEETHATTPESSPATDIPARTIEPSKILTPPDIDYFNTYRVDQKEVLPHQSPPVPHRAVINPVNARRMRSVSASSAFDTPIKTPPLHPLLSPVPMSHHPHMIQPQGTPIGIVTREQAIMAGEKETDGLRSPRGTRKAPLPADGSSVPPQSPLSPRGEAIPTEIPGSPKRKRHTVSVGESASAANAANGKKRRQRQKKTPTQVAVLERHFVINPHPDKQTRDTLALQLGFTSRQVQIWFQNARAKAKQNARKNGIEMTNAPTMANGTVMPPLNGHKHPQLSMNPTNGMHPHPQQTQHQPIAPAGPLTNGGRKIFSPPAFNPADLNPLSPPQSPISPYLSSLALSPRFPTRAIHPHAPQHNPMVYNTTVNNTSNNSLHHSNPDNSNTVLEGVNNTTNMLSPPALTMADVASLTGVVSMEEVPCTPPVTNMLSQPVSPAQASSMYNEVQQLTLQTAAEALQQQTATDVPLSPPPPSSPLEDFPQLSMSAPSPFSVLQKQMLEDQGHSMAGVTTAGGDVDSYEDPFALPSSPPLPSSYGPPLVPLLPQAVFFSEQNQKAALAHLEHNDGLSRQQQQMFQHHTLLTQQHFMQQQSLNNHHQQQQQALTVATQAASISSEMDFFFYEAPSKNLVQFGDADGDGDFFWGGVDSLNP